MDIQHVGAKIGVATYINEIESNAYLKHYLSMVTLFKVVGESIKTVEIMRGTLDAAFELNNLQILSKKARTFQRAELRDCNRKL